MSQGQLRSDIGPVIASVERELQATTDVHRVLERIVALAAGHVESKRPDGHGSASVSLVRQRRRVVPAVSSDPRATLADALQAELGQGPTLEAVWRQDSALTDDTATDGRHPLWERRVLEEAGIRSSLSLRLFTAGDSLGALTLYSSTPRTFTGQDVAEGLVFAAQAAVALRSAQVQEQLRRAIESRTVIGQAQGILMERFGIDAPRAFEVLRRVSQDTNVRLAAVAARLVEDRRTPGT